MRSREGAWLGHMASHRQNLLPTAMIFEPIHHPTQHLRRWAGRGGKPSILYPSPSFSMLIQFFTASLRLHLTHLCNNLQSSMPMQVRPLSYRCSQEANSPSFRTQVGRRCPIGCCIDLFPGLHFMHSPYCSRLSATSLLFCSPLWPQSYHA